MTTAAPAPGWYPYGRAASVAEWDGRAWTGHREVDPSVPAPRARHRRPWVFLTRLWFWLVVAGIAVTAASGVVGNNISSRWWIAPAMVGLVLALAGIVVLFRPMLRFAELGQVRLAVGVGVISGIIGLVLASLLEGMVEPRAHVSFGVDLWLSGPIEETCKIAVPVLLLIVARNRFGDPRIGVLMVLVSGAVFGVGEGFEYVAGGSGTNSHLLQSLVRPLAEISHPLWATIAVGAIWLAAHRSGRVFTWAGLAGWFTASFLHSLHDGLFAWRQSGDDNRVVDQDLSMGEVVESAVGGNIISLIAAVVTFLVLRHVLREIVPPTAVAANPPHWRPRLALWGVPAAAREQLKSERAASEQAASDRNADTASPRHAAGHHHGSGKHHGHSARSDLDAQPDQDAPHRHRHRSHPEHGSHPDQDTPGQQR